MCAASLTVHLGVEGVAQAVAHQVEGQDGRQQADAGGNPDEPVVGEHVGVVDVVDDVAPRGERELHAQAEERERRRDNGGSVVFVNPATDWKSEKKGLYEAVLAKTMVDQTGFSKGLLYDRANREYFIFASPAMTCLYGYGPGGDYIAKYCLRELTGQSAMKSLGIDDITITAAVLEKLSFEASVNDRNIIIVSKDNDQSIENAMMARTDNCFSDNGSFDEIFYKYIDGYQRWNGRLSETFNRKKIGLTVSTHVFDIPTSPDNTSVRSSFHKIGAVVFHKDNGKGKKPLLLCFHGGGDTALATATIAGWPQIAREEDFILCATEMHTLQTATEVMDVLEEIKNII